MDNQNILSELQGKLASVMKLSTQVINNLPNEVKIQIPNAQTDTEKIFKAFKKGDYSAITEIQQKYADLNNK